MARYAEIQVLPVKPVDKRAAFAAETGWMSHRLEAFERTRAAAGVTMERVALMETPTGSFTIAHREGDRDFEEVKLIFRNSADIFDIDMKNRGRILHGLSEAEQITHRVPLEMLLDHSTAPERRGPWHAFAAPIAPGAKQAWRSLCGDLSGSRKADFAALAARSGVTVIRGALYDKGAGDYACYYVEGAADDTTLPRALRNGGAFEAWLTERWQEVHGSDLRSGIPLAPVGICWDWAIGAPNDPVAPIFASFAALFRG